jgi:hypothetical protein
VEPTIHTRAFLNQSKPYQNLTQEADFGKISSLKFHFIIIKSDMEDRKDNPYLKWYGLNLWQFRNPPNAQENPHRQMIDKAISHWTIPRKEHKRKE